MLYRNTNLFCLAYIVIWSLVPAFSLYTNSGIFRTIFALILLLWILTGIINLNQGIRTKIIFSFSCFIFVAIVYYIVNYGNSTFYDMVNYVFLFATIVNSLVYNGVDSAFIDGFVFTVTLSCITLTSLTTLVGLLVNANASRLLTSSSTNVGMTNLLRKANIGAFDFIYGILICLPLMLKVVTAEKSIITKVYVAVVSILAVSCVIMANFTTAYIILFLEFILIIVHSRFKGVTGRAILAILFVPLLYVLPALLSFFLKSISMTTSSILSLEKINSIVSVLHGEEEIRNISSRFELLNKSLRSFFDRPVIGVGAFYGTHYQNPIGQHSQFVDDFARYGLLGGVPIVYCLVVSIRLLMSPRVTGGDLMYIPLIAFILTGLLNPAYNFGILICFFIVCPCLSRIIRRYRGVYIDEDNVSH